MNRQRLIAIAALSAVSAFAIGAGFGARSAAAATAPKTTYLVEIKTGCLPKSGTDADVVITLMKPGYGVSQGLDNPDVNDFETGRTDSFRFTTTDIGDIDMIALRHDNSGSSPGWLVDRVMVYNYRTAKWYRFPVQRWLATDSCDLQTSIIVTRDVRPTCTPYYYGPGSGC
jgi:hypothetical protein